MTFARIQTINIGGAQVDVWHIDLRAPGDPHLLSVDERERAERLRMEAKRRRFIAARAGLRLILAGYAQIAPDALIIGVGAHGKPYLVNMPHVEFNLAHTEDTALLAVSTLPVGIDVEQVRALSSLEQMVALAFTPEEHAELAALPHTERTAAFFRAWTRKEALMKAHGEGFRLAKTFSVPTDPQAQSIHVNGWTIQDLMLPNGLTGAVAAHTKQI